MLHLISNAPDFMITNIDMLFDTIKVFHSLHDIESVLADNHIYFLHTEDIMPDDYPSNIFISSDFGKTLLSNIPSGLKAFIIAAVYKREGRNFCCPEFVVGANLFPYFAELAKDVNTISLWAPKLRPSAHYSQNVYITCLVDGKEKQILC